MARSRWLGPLGASFALAAVPLALFPAGAFASAHHVRPAAAERAVPGTGALGPGVTRSWNPLRGIVFTRILLHQEDVSYGALGGEMKNFTVTLMPSNPQAQYSTGTVTLGCATVSHGIVNFQQFPFYNQPVVQAVAASQPGSYTLPVITNFIFSHSSPICGVNPMGGPYTIYIRYSGGFSNGAIYTPDTFCAVPVVPEGFNNTSTNSQWITNVFGCRNT